VTQDADGRSNIASASSSTATRVDKKRSDRARRPGRYRGQGRSPRRSPESAELLLQEVHYHLSEPIRLVLD
jgi:hypothetical protein